MISYPLTVFNSKNVEKEKRRYRKLAKRLFERLKNLKKLRSIIEDVIKLGKEAYSLKIAPFFRVCERENIRFYPINRDDF
jgi:hypothetical protein